MSFSNYFEGFAVDDECDVSDRDKPLLCGSDPVIRRRLHNLVRINLKAIHYYYAQYMVIYTGPHTTKWNND